MEGGDENDKQTYAPVFREFIKKFRAIIDNSASGHRELIVAIKGYGYFAAVSVQLVGGQKLRVGPNFVQKQNFFATDHKYPSSNQLFLYLHACLYCCIRTKPDSNRFFRCQIHNLTFSSFQHGSKIDWEPFHAVTVIFLLFLAVQAVYEE